MLDFPIYSHTIFRRILLTNGGRRIILKTYISKSKRSKKARKALNSENRKSWNGLCPTTQIVPSKKKYNRKKLKNGDMNFEI